MVFAGFLLVYYTIILVFFRSLFGVFFGFQDFLPQASGFLHYSNHAWPIPLQPPASKPTWAMYGCGSKVDRVPKKNGETTTAILSQKLVNPSKKFLKSSNSSRRHSPWLDTNLNFLWLLGFGRL